jgi:hypothetical protein
VTSPSYTSFVSFTRTPIARRNASASTAVLPTSALYTSLPTIGQNGTRAPSSAASASASAVFPVPGAPARRSARPENLRDWIRATTTPHACYLQCWLGWGSAYPHLARGGLAGEPAGVLLRVAVGREAEPLDMRVRRDARAPGRRCHVCTRRRRWWARTGRVLEFSMHGRLSLTLLLVLPQNNTLLHKDRIEHAPRKHLVPSSR